MEALRQDFYKAGMLAGTTSSYMAQKNKEVVRDGLGDNLDSEMGETDDEEDDDDEGPVAGNQAGAMFDVTLAARSRSYSSFYSSFPSPIIAYLHFYTRVWVSMGFVQYCHAYRST
jgi:hypothetical protein